MSLIPAVTAVYRCEPCGGEETEGIWPAPDQDADGPPVADQVCPAGHVQTVEYPGFAFFSEAG